MKESGKTEAQKAHTPPSIRNTRCRHVCSPGIIPGRTLNDSLRTKNISSNNKNHSLKASFRQPFQKKNVRCIFWECGMPLN
mmetsp:Transcript_31897/g.48104  ORF Transcript_31897/g.48104 Transcript_31897/m.48104 type:complete len:81 (+) Transcript_31897:132-374(+)